MTEPPTLNRADTEAFLRALDPSADKFTFQLIDDNAQRKDPRLGQIFNASLGLLYRPLVKFNQQGAGVFVTVNLTDGRGRDAENIVAVRALFADLDGAPLPQTFHCKPHIIVESSPGKFHIYWLTRDCKLDQFTPLQKRLLQLYGGDPKVIDLPRVLRVPGFLHQKVDKHGRASVPFCSRLVELHDHPAYAVEEFIEGLPEEKELPAIAGNTSPPRQEKALAPIAANASPPEGDGANWWEQYGEQLPVIAGSSSGTKPWTADEEARLRSALDAIPVDESTLKQVLGDSHMVWITIGRGLERLGWGERGKAIWRDWSAKSGEFNERGLNTQWASFARTRNSGTQRKITVGTIYRYAKAFGWREPDEEQAEELAPIAANTLPTYPDNARTSSADARAELEQLIEAFLDYKPNWWEQFGGITRAVHAVRASTGIGKTRIAARVVARAIKSGRLTGPVGYAVPTHRLGEDIADLFRAEGLSAEVWRGRKALGKDGKPMCLDLGAVKIAEDLGVTIEEACCKGKDPAGRTVTCQYYETCAYQKQKTRTPDVWLFAHQMLRQKNKTLDGLSALFIDESFRDAVTSKPVKGLTIDEIEDAPDSELEIFRYLLAESLRKQTQLGGVPLRNIHTSLNAGNITKAIALEWKEKGKQLVMWPGMPAKERAAAAKTGTNTKYIRTFHRVWSTLREFVGLKDQDDSSADLVSGRLFLATAKTDHGSVKVVKTRGIHPIAEQYAVPTFVMDATLPAKSILEKWFPDVEIVGEIEVPMPSVTVKQVLGAPITKTKLAGKRNLGAMRRYVLQRWVETGRGDVLVVTQKDVEAALRATDLPPTIAVEHYNAISGLDQYKAVRLLVAIGRTLPAPEAVEADAGALSGIEPVKAGARTNRPRWYDRIIRSVRMRDGTAVAVETDQHPDELAEAIRWQICEAEIMQAIGRGRGVNRTAETPLDVDILCHVVLPITVDQVDEWRAPGLEVEMIAAGVWLESPADMARAWPGVWANEQAARNWLRTNAVYFPLIVDSYQGKLHSVRLLRVRYQLTGPKQNWHHAWIDPAACPDARAWLEARLGPLAGFEAATVLVRMMRAVEHRVVPLDFATPSVSVRPGPGQEKFAWSAPVVEEIFPTPEEVAALWKLPAVIEGADRFPWPTPKALQPFVSRQEIEAFWALPLARSGFVTICKN